MTAPSGGYRRYCRGSLVQVREAGHPHWAGQHSNPAPSDPGRGACVSLARPALLPTGLFGTGIQSYFTFLRFLLLLNLLTVGLTASVVLLPLAWLRPPDPGSAQNLSEYWSSPLILWARPGMLPVPSLAYPCPAFCMAHFRHIHSVRVGARLGRAHCCPLMETPPDCPSPSSTALQCPAGHQPQTGSPKFHNQLWNVLTGRVSGVALAVTQGSWEAPPPSKDSWFLEKGPAQVVGPMMGQREARPHASTDPRPTPVGWGFQEREAPRIKSRPRDWEPSGGPRCRLRGPNPGSVPQS